MSAALWATARISVGESEHVLAQSNAWEKEREADGCFKHAARGKEETGGVERKRHNLCTKDTSTTFKGILCLC